MKVLLEAKRRWQQANLIVVISMFLVITETFGGESLYLHSFFPMSK